MSDFPSEQFPTSAELLKRLQERSDDFESVTIMVVNDMSLTGPPGTKPMLAKDCCGIIRTCTGESILIHREELQTLVNEGILQRLKIPITLLPQVAR